MPSPGFEPIDVWVSSKRLFLSLCTAEERSQCAQFDRMLRAEIERLGYSVPKDEETPEE